MLLLITLVIVVSTVKALREGVFAGMLLKDISQKAKEYGWTIPVEITDRTFQEVVVGRVEVPGKIEERLELILCLATKAVKKVRGRCRFVRFKVRLDTVRSQSFDLFIALTLEKSVIIGQVKEAKELAGFMVNDEAP